MKSAVERSTSVRERPYFHHRKSRMKRVSGRGRRLSRVNVRSDLSKVVLRFCSARAVFDRRLPGGEFKVANVAVGSRVLLNCR
jgi:hypothetical protein